MKVFFASSTSQLEKFYPIYKLICNMVLEKGHELSRDWLDAALEVIKKNLNVNFEEMYEDIISSILEADVGIVEGTVKGLSTGHQMTVALLKGKPILFLHQETGTDNFPFMVPKEQAELFTERIYSKKEELPAIISEFLDKNKRGKRVRFNLVLNPKEEKYIEWASFTYKKSKTEIIRQMLADRILTDINYQRLQKK